MNDIANGNNEKIEGILSVIQNHQQSADALISVEVKKIQYVFFTLGADRYYAFEGDAVKEILTIGRINPVFGCPEAILGMINIRGEMESVISLHAVLGLTPPQITAQSRILIAADGRLHSGIFVDKVDDVAEIPENTVLNNVYKMEPDIARAETDFQGRHYIVLDVARIFVLVEKLCGLRDDQDDAK